jgi:hypothetical protein
MNQRMKPTCLALLLAALPAAAATVTWDAEGSNDLWTTPENWSDNLTPAAGNDYLVSGAGVIVRPPDATSNTFAGDSLTIADGAVLNLYRTNGGGYFNASHAIANLTVSNAEIRPQSSNGSLGNTLTSAVELDGNVTVNMTVASNFTMRLFFDGAITGSGNLALNRTATGTERLVQFNGDASGYSGDIGYAGLSGDVFTFTVNNTGGWGTGDLAMGQFTTLNLTTAFASLASSLAMSATGTTLNLGDGATTIGGLSIGGNAVENGTYDAAGLTGLGFGGTYAGTGTLTVIPEPAVALLGSFGLLALLRRRRG